MKGLWGKFGFKEEQICLCAFELIGKGEMDKLEFQKYFLQI